MRARRRAGDCEPGHASARLGVHIHAQTAHNAGLVKLETRA